MNEHKRVAHPMSVLAAAVAALVFVGVLFAVGRVDRRVDGRLLRADSIMNIRPDSAFRILTSIDSTVLSPGYERSFYRLLLAEAQYKINVDVLPDSVLALSTRYFESSGDDRELMRTYFMRAITNYYAARYYESMLNVAKSLDIAQRLNDYEYLGRTHYLIADLNNLSMNYPNALEHQRLACDYYSKAGMERYLIFNKVDEVRVDVNLGQYQEAKRLLDSIGRNIDLGDSMFMRYYFTMRVILENHMGLVEKSCASLDTLKMYSPDNDYDHELESRVLLSIGKNAEVKVIIDSLISLDTIPQARSNVQACIFDYYEAIGDYPKALDEMKKYIGIQRDILKSNLNESLGNAMTDLYSEKYRDEKLKRDRQKLYVIIAFLLTAIVVAVGYMSYRLKLRRKDVEISMKMEALRQAVRECNEKDALLCEWTNAFDESIQSGNILKRRLGALYGRQLEMLEALCRDYFNKRDASEKIKMSFFADVDRRIKSLKKASELKKMERELNEYSDGLVERLDCTLPGLNKADRTFLILSFAGLSPMIISLACDMTVNNVYAKRKRFKERLAEINTDDAIAISDALDNYRLTGQSNAN